MNIGLLKQIFAVNCLPEPLAFRKIEVGFTNSVYAVDEKYIVKFCGNPSNTKPFTLEAELYKKFRGRLPVPQPLAFDATSSVVPEAYMIYPMIDGENLYNVWHVYSHETRESIIKQLCGMLRYITNTDTTRLGLLLDTASNWKDVIIGRIRRSTAICTEAGTLAKLQARKIERYCEEHGNCLNEQKMALVYWDAHFDNILVKDGAIAGLLDFERCEIASIDFMLDVVKRMVEFPKKYMSEYAEQFANGDDYIKLFQWYRKYYPELFEFAELKRRLDFYSLAHDLEDLVSWPTVRQLKDNIEKVLE